MGMPPLTAFTRGPVRRVALAAFVSARAWMCDADSSETDTCRHQSCLNISAPSTCNYKRFINQG